MIKIPKSKRLEVYKEALKIIESNKDVFKLGKSFQLCFILPIILTESESWACEWFYKGEEIVYWETDDIFPEFGKYHNNDYEYSNEYRIQILKEIIHNMSIKLTPIQKDIIKQLQENPDFFIIRDGIKSSIGSWYVNTISVRSLHNKGLLFTDDKKYYLTSKGKNYLL
jgi:hypothetical protein